MRRVLPAVILVLTVLGAGVDAWAQARPARPARPAAAGPRVRWMISFDKAKVAAEKADAPLLLFFYLDNHAPSAALAQKLLADVTFRKLSGLFVMVRLDGRQEKDLAALFGVQAYPTIVMLDSAATKVYALDASKPPKAVVQYMVRTFLISMFNSGKRQKDAGHVRSAILKFKWVQALAPDTPPARWSDRELRRIQADGIRKLSQAAISKEDKDYLKTMELLDELVYEYRGTNAGDQAAQAMTKLLGEPETADAYREVVRRQLADRKLHYARKLHAAQDLQGALIVYWDVTRDFPRTPAAETAAKHADELAGTDAELVVKASAAREERDGRHWLEMARSFEMNKRTDKALDYLGRILKYYPDSSWAEKARAERDRLTAAKPGK